MSHTALYHFSCEINKTKCTVVFFEIQTLKKYTMNYNRFSEKWKWVSYTLEIEH